MREIKSFLNVLRDIIEVVEQEASQNTAFSNRLEAALKGASKKPSVKDTDALGDLPDLFNEAKSRTDEALNAWLGTLDIPTLKGLIRKYDLDSSRRSSKWSDHQKFAKLIAEKVRARVRRGSAFLSTEAPEDPIPS